MDLKAGYKQTEIGVLPADWAVKRLGDLGSVVRGSSPRPAGDPRFFGGNFIPWLTVGSLTNISDSQLHITETASGLTREGANRSRSIPKDTLVIVNSGARTLGVTKILSIMCCANDGIAALLNQRSGDKRFICYYLNSQIRRMRQVIAAGNDQLNLNTSRIGSILVPFPDYEEQVAIADALSDADASIGSLEALIVKKRLFRQGTAQTLLTGEVRLSRSHKKWVPTALGQVADVLKGNGLSRTKISESGDRPCILYGELFTTYGRTITDVVSHTNTREGIPSVRGDVLMPGSTTTKGIDLAIASALLANGVALGGDINIIRNRSDAYDPIFLANYLTHARRIQIAELAQGITIHHLYGRDLRQLLLHLPSLAEQREIAAVLADLDVEIEVLVKKLVKARGLRDGMAKELLTGGVRLRRPRGIATPSKFSRLVVS